MQHKILLLGGAALGALIASPSLAQTTADTQASAEAQATPAAGADQTGDDIVVTGTRTAGRTRLDSVSPVDVLSRKALQNQGTTEVAAALANVAPSIDFPRPAVTDATDAIRPATLRGLSPDQTLVLINGVRAHPSALLNINGSVGRGAAAVDLNTIPDRGARDRSRCCVTAPRRFMARTRSPASSICACARIAPAAAPA